MSRIFALPGFASQELCNLKCSEHFLLKCIQERAQQAFPCWPQVLSPVSLSSGPRPHDQQPASCARFLKRHPSASLCLGTYVLPRLCGCLFLPFLVTPEHPYCHPSVTVSATPSLSPRSGDVFSSSLVHSTLHAHPSQHLILVLTRPGPPSCLLLTCTPAPWAGTSETENWRSGLNPSV